MAERPHWNRRQIALGTFHLLSDDIVCRILNLLSPHDIGNLACVSSVFNILCNEEPLWMQLCLQTHQGYLDYKGTWKQTALAKLVLTKDIRKYSKPPQQFQVERRSGVLPAEFSASYDGKKPVLLTDLLNDWPASKSWSLDQLVQKCGDAEFKVSQPHGKSVPMKLADFSGYMDMQHDEEPLYIFDPEFGETVPELLNDYKVPALFSDDLFSVLGELQRPPFRWLVLGPARSGASWHVDPSLTCAWNSLLSGRKRWAFYPPGKVPPGVTLDVDEDDGSVHYDGPTSLQWWLDVYPHLNEIDKPLECTQLQGETIYVPSGWWHCVLNINCSIAVTQNFVNANNLEVVCMDLAPGFRHRAIARAGKIALDGQTITEKSEMGIFEHLANPMFTSSQDHAQQSPTSNHLEESDLILAKTVKSAGSVTDPNLRLALDALKMSSEEDQAPSEGKNMGESMTRKWLRNLWVTRPEIRHVIWKGACLALDAGTWLHRINVICSTFGFPQPVDEDQLPVGDGSNPVYLVGDYVIKLYIQEAGPNASIDGLGSELNFYALLKESGSSFQEVVPETVTSGILYLDGEDYKAVPWDGTGDCSLVSVKEMAATKKRHRDSTRITRGRFRTKWSANTHEPKIGGKGSPAEKTKLWPYLVTKRCPGRILSEVRQNMTENDIQSLAIFLGKQVRFLHTLPLPTFEQSRSDNDGRSYSTDNFSEEQLRGRDSKEAKYSTKSYFSDECLTQPKAWTRPTPIAATVTCEPEMDIAGSVDIQWEVPKVWDLFVSFLRRQRKTVHERLQEWGSLPDHLLKQVETYLPKDPVVLIGDVQVQKGAADISRHPVWIHTDLMTDNILVDESGVSTVESEVNTGDCASDQRHTKSLVSQRDPVIQARYILDYGDLLHGDPLYDLLPLHLDVFNLEGSLLELLLRSYQLPFSSPKTLGVRHLRRSKGAESDRQYTLSYCAMCYCLLHELDTMATIFKLRHDIKAARSLEDIEVNIWGFLNDYKPDKYFS